MPEININCCSKNCPIGKKMSEHLLNTNNSAYDAAMDFCFFVEQCHKTCSYNKFENTEKIEKKG